MKPTHLVFIFSDQHNRNVTGCYGNPIVQTPNIDRLAARGTRFTNAYTNSPLCCPARASMITGRYVHQLGAWDNAFPYDGSPPGWGHLLKQQGVQVAGMGKMHFRSHDDDNGFTQEYNTMHVVEGTGDVLGCLRNDTSLFDKRKGVIDAGIGESSYLGYDAENAAHACRWIQEHQHDEQPWMLYLGIALPHPPNLVPEAYYNLYASQELPMPPQWDRETWPTHPAVDYFRKFFNFEEPIPESAIQNFLAAYYGACSYIDDQIGKVLDTLDETGLNGSTRVIYSTDHGECLGARGIFGKFTMYDESAALPFLMSGPDIPERLTVDTPISLVDCYPTLLDAFGVPSDELDESLPGQSLWSLMPTPPADRTIFSEYHGPGTRDAVYMLRNRQYKYIYSVNASPQLFDLHEDPDEIQDLSSSSAHDSILRDFEHTLRTILDPEAIDAKAKAEQEEKIEAAGGAEALRQKGTFDNSPIPGEEAVYFTR